MNKIKLKIFFLLNILILGFSCSEGNPITMDQITIEDGNHQLLIDTNTFQFQFKNLKKDTNIPEAKISGLFINGSPITNVSHNNFKKSKNLTFKVKSDKGISAEVTVFFKDGIVKFIIVPELEGNVKVSIRTGGMSIAHGLGDAGSYGESFNLLKNNKKVYPIINNGGTQRWASSFVIFPKNEIAGVFFSKGSKTVIIDEQIYAMETFRNGEVNFYYFLGDLKGIYANYKKIRLEEGFEDVKPKSRLFELGWESWDALGWNTNQSTVKNVLQKFIDNKYPIKWAVTGSGFWETGGTTTSFGKWGENFSEASTFKNWINSKDISWMIGLRTNFIPEGGPYYPKTDKRDGNLKVTSFNGNLLSKEALEKDYFVKITKEEPYKFTSSIFPIVPSYLLNGEKKEAAIWYQKQYAKWSVDGIKEDTMMDLDSLITIYNAPIAEIANKGGLVMARNGNYIVPGTLLRINDTRVKSMEDRIPINYFQYAASGFPNVYSDVAGAHNMHNIDDIDRSIRHTWLLSLTAGLAVGAYPDKWSTEQQRIFKKAIDFHNKLVPYMYSAALEGYKNGYPTTLTPLTIAYSKDPSTSKLKNYEWLIGESILATPLLKNYKSNKMDVYLPEGIWYDYEVGTKYEGPITLADFEIPLDKAPIFIGGKGIIVERIHQKLIAKIYPVLNKTSIAYWGLDGETKSIISIENPNWNGPKVIETETGDEVPFKKNVSAFEFDLIEGKNYSIE